MANDDIFAPIPPFHVRGDDNGSKQLPSMAPATLVPTIEKEYPSPQSLIQPFFVSWNIPLGEPTPDPALINDPVTPPNMVKGCDNVFEEFEATVLVDYGINKDPEAIPQSELDRLNELFANEYNNMSQSYCDPLFRTIQNATHTTILDSARPRVQQYRHLGTGVTSTFKVSVHGKCRGLGCAYKSAGAGLTTLPSDSKINHGRVEGIFANRDIEQRVLLDGTEGGGVVVCGCLSIDPHYRSPTTEEMISQYSSIAAALSSISSVSQMTQVLLMPGCDDVTEEYDVELLMEMETRNPGISGTELDALSSSFISDYNGLTTNGCDAIFRRSSNVTVTVANTARRLEAYQQARRLGSDTFFLTGKAVVKGKCKGFGCSSKVTQLQTSNSASGGSGGSNAAVVQKTKATGLFAKLNVDRRLSGSTVRFHHHSRFLQAGLSAEAMECFCPDLNPELRPPTSGEMVKKYNITVNDLHLPNVNGIGDISQIVEQACEKEKHTFEAILLVDYKVQDPDWTTNDDFALASAFVQEYNKIAENLCDPMYRRLTDATITKIASRLQDSVTQNSRRLVGSIVTVKIQAKGTCHGYGCNDEIVGSNAGGVWVQGLFGTKPNHGRRLADESDGCLCKSSQQEFRPPTEIELLANYNTATSAISSNIDQVTNILQVLEMPGCDDVTEEFDVTLLMEIEANNLDVTDGELGSLGSSFINDYNDLATNGCDSIFRRTSNSTVSIENVRRRLGGRKLSTYMLTGKATVKGICKGFGCSAKVTQKVSSNPGHAVGASGSNAAAVKSSKASGLFASKNVNRRLATVKYFRHSRFLQLALSEEQMACYCPDLNPQLLPPTTAEMVVVYNESVNTLALPSVEGIGDIAQVTEQTCPEVKEEFVATVIIDVEVDNAVMPDQQVKLLSDAFTYQYNEFSASFCDQQFRRISKTTLKKIENVADFAKGALSQGSRRISNTFILSFEATVNGVCRGIGCQKKVVVPSFVVASTTGSWFTDGLFSEESQGFRRRQLIETYSSIENGSHQWGDCECAAQSDNGIRRFLEGSGTGVPLKANNRPPTIHEMLVGYNKTAIAVVSTLVSVLHIYQVAEMVGCDDVEEKFEAIVLMDVDTRNPAITDKELQVLGSSFMANYNELARLYCDPLFRRVASVSVDFGNVRRRIESFQKARRLESGTFNITGELKIIGTCKGVGCSNRVSLGPNNAVLDAIGSNAAAVKYTKATGLFALSGESLALSTQSLGKADCFCSSVNPGYRPPKAEELAIDFNLTVANLDLQAVVGIVNLTQVYPIEGCNGIIEEYDVILAMDVGANSTDVSAYEREMLETVFADKFNYMTAENCDPEFRRVSNTTIIFNGARRRRANEMGRRSLGAFVLTGKATVKGRCRGFGCGTKITGTTKSQGSDANMENRDPPTGLFANVNRRVISGGYRQLGSQYMQTSRALNAKGECFCNSLNPESRPPTSTELVHEYNATIAGLNLPTVQAILGITEITNSPAPTPEPSPTQQPVPDWNIEAGSPTPDPALQLIMNVGTPVLMNGWVIPDGGESFNIY